MPPRTGRAPVDLGRSLLDAWATNAEITRYLLENLDAEVWRAEPPVAGGRTIAQTFAHIHNVRRMLMVMARIDKVPPKLDRHRVTAVEAHAALAKSADGIARVAKAALDSDGRVKNLHRDVAAFVLSAVTHEAHHRGQICTLARQLGFPISPETNLQMWDWSKRAKAAARLA